MVAAAAMPALSIRLQRLNVIPIADSSGVAPRVVPSLADDLPTDTHEIERRWQLALTNRWRLVCDRREQERHRAE